MQLNYHKIIEMNITWHRRARLFYLQNYVNRTDMCMGAAYSGFVSSWFPQLHLFEIWFGKCMYYFIILCFHNDWNMHFEWAICIMNLCLIQMSFCVWYRKWNIIKWINMKRNDWFSNKYRVPNLFRIRRTYFKTLREEVQELEMTDRDPTMAVKKRWEFMLILSSLIAIILLKFFFKSVITNKFEIKVQLHLLTTLQYNTTDI